MAKRKQGHMPMEVNKNTHIKEGSTVSSPTPFLEGVLTAAIIHAHEGR